MNKTASPAAAADSGGAGPANRKKARARRMRRRAAVFAGAFAAVCALTGGAALTLVGSASAGTGNPVITLQNMVTDRCLEDDNGSVSTQPCDGSYNQEWSFSVISGYYAVVSHGTGRCLQNDGYGDGYGNLSTQPCTGVGADGQIWADKEPNGYPGNVLQDRYSRLCLESDPYGNAYAQQCLVDSWQSWQLSPASTPPSPSTAPPPSPSTAPAPSTSTTVAPGPSTSTTPAPGPPTSPAA